MPMTLPQDVGAAVPRQLALLHLRAALPTSSRCASTRRAHGAAAQAAAEQSAEAGGDDKATPLRPAPSGNGIASAASVADEATHRRTRCRARRCSPRCVPSRKGDLYVAFTSCLKQLIDGKMEASTYEDAMRTLLGTNAYLLFTLHKIIAQALKQLQMILVEETSQKLIDLYHYERRRASGGLLLRGDLPLERAHGAGGRRLLPHGAALLLGRHRNPLARDAGGALVLAFLPEKEEDDDEDVEEEDDDDDDDGDEAGKAETVAYMRSFMQRARSIASLPKSNGRGALLLKRKLRSPRKPLWTSPSSPTALECRSTGGLSKLRFVSRSEDVWFVAAARSAKSSGGKKKRSGGGGGGGGKRRKLASALEGKGSKDGPNALLGAGQRQDWRRCPSSTCLLPPPKEDRRRWLVSDEAIDRRHAGAVVWGGEGDAAASEASGNAPRRQIGQGTYRAISSDVAARGLLGYFFLWGRGGECVVSQRAHRWRTGAMPPPCPLSCVCVAAVTRARRGKKTPRGAERQQLWRCARGTAAARPTPRNPVGAAFPAAPSP